MQVSHICAQKYNPLTNKLYLLSVIEVSAILIAYAIKPELFAK
jgi:hypothetical protein